MIKGIDANTFETKVEELAQTIKNNSIEINPNVILDRFTIVLIEKRAREEIAKRYYVKVVEVL